MLFNCFSCGKLISLKKDLCPYCMVDLMEARNKVEEEVKAKKPSLGRPRTIFSLLFR